MLPSGNHLYAPVRKYEDVEDVLQEEPLTPRFSHNQHNRIPHWTYFTHGVLVILCLVLMVLWIHATHRSPSVLPYSPANEAVEYYKEYRPFKGALNSTSAYRGSPSPAIDAAWIKVSTGVPPLRITREELVKSGHSDTPSKVKYSEKDGGGYMAALEVTHQLHCLDILRKSVYLEYYSQIDPLFKAGPETYRFHLDHCIDILRQVLMCSADVGMIAFEWVQGFSGPYPDFNTKHQCRNFERVISWGFANAAKVPNHRITRLEGEVDLVQVP